MKIFCCKCESQVEARLTNGKEIYPYRKDLYSLPFWKHDECGNYVGCHHKTKDKTRPLGVIPTPELRKIRQEIHALLDPLWQTKQLTRQEVYRHVSKHLGYEYHTAELVNVDEGIKVMELIKNLNKDNPIN